MRRVSTWLPQHMHTMLALSQAALRLCLMLVSVCPHVSPTGHLLHPPQRSMSQHCNRHWHLRHISIAGFWQNACIWTANSAAPPGTERGCSCQNLTPAEGAHPHPNKGASSAGLLPFTILLRAAAANAGPSMHCSSFIATDLCHDLFDRMSISLGVSHKLKTASTR